MKRIIILMCSLSVMVSITAQSSIDPKDVKQTPSFRMVTDDQIKIWNWVFTQNTINAGVVRQDDDHRFVTVGQIANWNKAATAKAPAITTADLMEDPSKQFVTTAEKKKWNANTRIVSSFNIGFYQVNDSTIRAVPLIPPYNTFDRDRLPAPEPGSIKIIFNTDTKKLNFRTNTTTWEAIWSS